MESALAAVTARAETAEAVAGNMLNHLLPDTIRAIVLDLSAAERHAPDMGEFAITPQTLEFRDKCTAFLGAEWPDSAWDEEWLTALDAERARRADGGDPALFRPFGRIRRRAIRSTAQCTRRGGVRRGMRRRGR